MLFTLLRRGLLSGVHWALTFWRWSPRPFFALGRYRGFKTRALALVVDNVISGEELTEQREELELRMVQIALEGAN